MPRQILPWAVCGGVIALATGCIHPVREQVDSTVCCLAAKPIDIMPTSSQPARTASGLEGDARGDGEAEEPPGEFAIERAPDPRESDASGTRWRSSRSRTALPLAQVARVEEAPPEKPPAAGVPERLQLPPDLPGAQSMPVPELPTEPEARKLAIRKLFPPLPPLGADPTPRPGPEDRPFTLADLQRLALSNSPLIRQAAAKVEAARGAALQARAYPNPSVGFEGDTMGTGRTAGFVGGFIEQLIKTGGKLKLAQASALMDLANAELALQRAKSDLVSQVRTGYFAVLSAEENMKVNRALVNVTEGKFYSTLIEQAVAGFGVAPYEPKLLRVIVLNTRSSLMLSRNRYTSAWKSLAATLGLPGLPPTQIAGSLELPLPAYDYEAIAARMLAGHTDILAARNGVQKARYDLRLAQVVPVPDVDVRLVVQKDYTLAPFDVVSTVQVGVPLPVWDRNKGGIMQAQGNLLNAIDEEHRVRDDLLTRLADAFERYENNRHLRASYLSQAGEAVQAYRLALLRYDVDPNGVQFSDLLAIEQTLVNSITSYLAALATQWTAAVEVANLLQTDDLFGVNGDVNAPANCPLRQLLELPCTHPCSPLPPAAALQGPDGGWHAAVPIGR